MEAADMHDHQALPPPDAVAEAAPRPGPVAEAAPVVFGPEPNDMVDYSDPVPPAEDSSRPNMPANQVASNGLHTGFQFKKVLLDLHVHGP